MTRNSYRSSLIHGTHNAEVEIVNEDGHWLVGCTATMPLLTPTIMVRVLS